MLKFLPATASARLDAHAPSPAPVICYCESKSNNIKNPSTKQPASGGAIQEASE